MTNSYKIMFCICVALLMQCERNEAKAAIDDLVIKSSVVSMNGLVKLYQPPNSQVQKTIVDDKNRLYIFVFSSSKPAGVTAAYYEKTFISPTDDTSVKYRKTNPLQGHYSIDEGLSTFYVNDIKRDVYSYLMINGRTILNITVNKTTGGSLIYVTYQLPTSL